MPVEVMGQEWGYRVTRWTKETGALIVQAPVVADRLRRSDMPCVRQCKKRGSMVYPPNAMQIRGEWFRETPECCPRRANGGHGTLANAKLCRPNRASRAKGMPKAAWFAERMTVECCWNVASQPQSGIGESAQGYSGRSRAE